MHVTPFGEKNFPLDYFVGHTHGRMFSCLYTTLTNLRTKFLAMCNVYTDVGGIK